MFQSKCDVYVLTMTDNSQTENRYEKKVKNKKVKGQYQVILLNFKKRANRSQKQNRELMAY